MPFAYVCSKYWPSPFQRTVRLDW